MVMTLRKRAPLPSPSPSSSSDINKKPKSKPKPKPKSKPKFSYVESSSSSSSSSSDDENEYEKVREQRIKENKERMLNLGIFSLSSQLHPIKRPPLKKKTYSSRSSDFRRSHRLKNVARGNYFETKTSLKDMGITIPDAWKPEVYASEDANLLGNCDTEWTLNVDGFGEDGERLYDPVNGTSCHQCRQKTIRKHTYCGNCRSPQGQLCGDCLYTRYGENVVEATLKPAWSCPACRGICNCSRCRRAKGWPPVNILYPKVTESGFKSVAHYLILTRCAGAITKESEEGTTVHDLTEGDIQAPLRYEGSDTSAEWSDSDGDYSDDDDSKTPRKNVAQSIETHGGAEPSSEAADKNHGSNEPTFNDCSVC